MGHRNRILIAVAAIALAVITILRRRTGDSLIGTWEPV